MSLRESSGPQPELGPLESPQRFDWSAGRARFALAVILSIAFTLYLVPLTWGLPGWRGWAPDEIDPQAVLKAAAHSFSGSWTSRYPPLHYYVLAGLYQPLDWVAGPGRLALGEVELNQLYFLAGRLLSVLLATATLWLVYRCSRVFHDRFTSCVATAATALMVPFTYYAKTVNLEVPYLFWFVLSLLFFARLLHGHRLPDYLAFSAAASFAVCTKDQTYALYVLPVVMAPVVLAAHRRRQEDRRGGVFTVLWDRRLLWSAVVGVGLFIAIHKLPFDLHGFQHHIAEMRRASSTAAEFGNSLSGHLALALASLRLTAFNLGLPLFLAALVGVTAATLDFRKSWKLLSLLVFVVSYYLFFIVVIRYSYDRFFLPVALVLTLFAGPVVAKLLRWRRLPAAAAGIVLVGIFGFALLRAASVDAMMLADSRYTAEAWLTEHLKDDGVAVVGGRSVKLHVRGPDRMVWREGRHGSVADWLRDRDARFLVVHSEDPWVTSDLRIRERLLLGDLNFRPEARVHGEPAFNLLRLEGVRSNLTKLNAEILIAGRVADWGRPIDEVLAGALEALESDDPDRVAALADEIATAAIPGRRRLLGDLVVGLSGERFRPIHSGRPAVVVVTNPSDQELSIDLQLGLRVPRSGAKTIVRVVGGEDVQEVVVRSGPATIVRIGPVAAGRRGLFALVGKGNRPVVLKAPLRRHLAEGVWVAGVTNDFWTQEGVPAVVIYDNPTAFPRSVEVLLVPPPGHQDPLTVHVDGFGASASFEVLPHGRSAASLPPAPPYSRSAVLMTAPRPAEQFDNPSRLGFRIVPGPPSGR